MFEIVKEAVTNSAGEQHLYYRVTGSIGIESIAELKRLLLEGLNSSEHLVLDWREVEEVDFTALQLMCAVNIYAHEHGKVFELKNSSESPVFRAAEHLGFMRETGCSKEKREDCLWLRPEASSR